MLLALALVPPTLYLVVVAGYLALTAFGAWRARRPDAPPRGVPAGDPPRIAVLIPAHNEETHIRDILGDLASAHYPDSAYTPFVIADNCDDATAEAARAAGATVFERQDPDLRGKGQALDWCLRTHCGTLAAYDVIVLIDADMRADPGFLPEIAASFQDPSVEALQGLHTIANPGAHWRAAMSFLGFAVVNHLRPAGRAWWGGSADLNGGAMAFRAPLLLRYGWPAHSLAEDVEFSKRLLLDGVRIHYNPGARVRQEMPRRADQARVQHERWEGGKRYVFRRYFPMLLLGVAHKPSWMRIDALLDIVVPPQSLLALMFAMAALLAWLVHPAWAGLLAGCAAVVAACILGALWLQRPPRRVWLFLAAAPIFALWKLALLFRVFRAPQRVEWRRTPREKELSGAGEDR